MLAHRFILGLLPLYGALGMAASGEQVHVSEQTSAGGIVRQLSDAIAETGTGFCSQTAPEEDGYIFTCWSISATQPFSNRDRWGRALDAATFTVYETTTLTANYLPETQDEDADGVADGPELYWYGNLDQTADSDTDGDGFTFVEELAAGTHPLFKDEYLPGGVKWADSGSLLYNPEGYEPFTLRSEPEGALFSTVVEYVRPGTSVTTPIQDHASSAFAYWALDGVRQADRWGRALDAVTFEMPSNAVEAVAVTADDAALRQQLYWYGAEQTLDSDTDDDGFAFEDELAAGTNPLFADEYLPGGMAWGDAGSLEYNREGYRPYTFRSEPEGTLFETVVDYVRPGTVLTTPACDHASSAFAYWALDGVRQADRWGRALDAVTFEMPSNAVEAVAVTADDAALRQQLYWYGAEQTLDSDTDDDGFAFEDELAAGTNPLFADEFMPGGIEWADSGLLKANLQPFEQLRTALVEGAAEEVFTSPVAGNEGESWAFGRELSPAVGDLDADGLFDLVLASMDGVRVLHNKGALASPDFEELASPFAGLAEAFAGAEAANRVMAGGEGGVYLAGDPIRFFPADGTDAVATGLSGIPAWFAGELYALDPATGAVATTNGALALDTPVIRGLSLAVADATQDGRPDLLASDDEGRVWLYRGNADGSFTLLHKVWGGTFGGFAEGLKIAAVDWDDDGDLDALGGTAEGRLMMLRDPRIGRPANARILAGLDSVVLSWEPNTQSRVRGYRVYRAPGTAAEADGAAFEKLTTPWTPLPTYRDLPPEIRDWVYRITTVSRFYTAGNSTPTETESTPTDLLEAALGGVTLALRDAAGFAGEEVEMGLSVNNSLGLAADGLELVIEYDAGLLAPVAAVPAGLGAGLQFASEVDGSAGRWTIRATGGEVAAGEGTLLTLRFRAAEGVEGEATVTLVSAALRAESGQTASAPVPVSGTVSIQLRNPLEPAQVAVDLPSPTVEAGGMLHLPVAIDATKPLDRGTATLSVGYDAALLTPASATVGDEPLAGTVADGVWTVSGFPEGTLAAGTNELLVLEWSVAAVEADATTEITLSTLDVWDEDGVAAETTTPVSTMVFIQVPEGGDGGEGDGSDTGDGGWEEDPDDPDDGVEGVDWHWSRTEVLFSVPNAAVRTGDTFDLPLATELFTRWFFAPRFAADGLRFHVAISYDPAVLEPVGIVAASGAALSTSNRFENGRWHVYGTGGTVPFGKSNPLSFRFRAVEQYAFDRSEVDFKTARVYDTAGDRMRCWKYKVPRAVSVQFTRPPDDPRVVAPWSKGDVDGNGRLERADLDRLRVLLDYAGYSGHGGSGNGHGGPGQHASVATELELRAGDMNGNGKLEEGDYQLLNKFLRGKGALED